MNLQLKRYFRELYHAMKKSKSIIVLLLLLDKNILRKFMLNASSFCTMYSNHLAYVSVHSRHSLVYFSRSVLLTSTEMKSSAKTKVTLPHQFLA